MVTREDRINGTPAYRRWYNSWKAKRRNKHKVAIYEIKELSRCVRCGFKDARALQFHHVTGKHKDVAVMTADGASLVSLMQEIKRCDILCANCHSIEHFGQAPTKRQPWKK